MSDELALLKAIKADLNEDLPRLVLADWLEEHGEPARAEFIRLQVAAAPLPYEQREFTHGYSPRHVGEAVRESIFRTGSVFPRITVILSTPRLVRHFIRNVETCCPHPQPPLPGGEGAKFIPLSHGAHGERGWGGWQTN
jgi:uncharacterized protein (TIGR02996 family)